MSSFESNNISPRMLWSRHDKIRSTNTGSKDTLLFNLMMATDRIPQQCLLK